MKLLKQQKGFTLIEIVVATTIFAFVAVAMMTLFNYTLKINRRSEALRQATQGVRNFVEYVVKTVRNGQIYYSVENGTVEEPVDNCPKPATSNPPNHEGGDTYFQKENRLSLVTAENEKICLFLGDASGNWVGSGVFTGETLVMAKQQPGIDFEQVLNPPNFKVENLKFLIRPLEDPYYDPPPPGSGGGSAVQQQPFVTIIMKVIAQLPTGEVQPIFYETSISSDKYDIPN